MPINLPNQITMARLILAVLFFVLICQFSARNPDNRVMDACLVIFIIACVTDWLDGELADELANERVGRVFEVVIDGQPIDGAQSARHAGQAPEVDSLTYVTGRRFEPGEFVEVRCTGSRDYDLIAQPTNVILPVIA